MSLAPFAPGDIFVTAGDLDESARFPTGMGKVLQYSADWQLKATHETGQRGLISALHLDRKNQLHILDPQARWVGALGPDGAPLIALPNLPPVAFGSMIELEDGFLLGEHMIGDIPGFNGKGDVYRVNASGTVVQSWDVETNGGVGGFLGVTHMALSHDGETLYHLSETGAHIYAHDLANDVRRGAIYTRTDPPPLVFGIAALSDNSLLAACGNEVRRVRANEGIVGKVDVPAGRGWAVVKLRPGGQSAWALDFFGGQLVSIDIESGAITDHQELGLAKCLAGIAEVPGE